MPYGRKSMSQKTVLVLTSLIDARSVPYFNAERALFFRPVYFSPCGCQLGSNHCSIDVIKTCTFLRFLIQ